jgi:hypothetical protein
MSDETLGPARVFKTAWFTKAANKANIGDRELCIAIRQAMNGQAVDLGGGVYKKRLNRNEHRSIIVAKGRRFWVFAYLFAKKDRDNIDAAELKAFRALADVYAAKSDEDIEKELMAGAITEICHGDEA